MDANDQYQPGYSLQAEVLIYYLTRVPKEGLDQPSFMRVDQYLPAEAPLLDYLIEDSMKIDGWKYPRLEDLESYQANRGLNLEML